MTWRRMRLRRILDATGGSWGTEPEGGQFVARCIRGTDFDSVRLRTAPERAPERGFRTDEFARRAARRGDLIIEKSGGGEQQPVGRVVLHDEDMLVMPTNFAGRLRPRTGIDARFICYLMASLYADGHTAAMVKQTTGIQNLDLGALLDLTVDVPIEGVQRAIADFLDTETARIDALISKKRRMIDLLMEARDRELDRKALPGFSPTKRDDPADLPLEDEMPDGWSSVQLGHLLRRITYGFTNPMPAADDGPFMVTANDVGDGEILVETARRTTSEAFDRLLTEKSRPRAGDVLLTKDGTLGRAAMSRGERMCVNQSVAVLTPALDQVDPLLLLELLRVPAYRDALVYNAGGTTIKHLYISRVVKQRVVLPPRNEQPRLAARLAQVHDLHRRRSTALTQSIAVLEERRQALITAAVTGELEIPGAAA